jgi:Trp operon repressor
VERVGGFFGGTVVGHPSFAQNAEPCFITYDEAQHGNALMPEQRPPIPADLDRGGANFQARLTEDRVHQIIGLLLEGQTQSAIAKQFGVAEATIRRIASGKAWKQVPRPPNFASKIRHSTAKLTEAQVGEIRQLLQAGHSQQVVGRKFNVGQATISDIATGRSWSWLRYD